MIALGLNTLEKNALGFPSVSNAQHFFLVFDLINLFSFAWRRKVPEARGKKEFWFSGGFFQTETVKRLRGSIFIQPEIVSPFMAGRDPENIQGLLPCHEMFLRRALFADRLNHYVPFLSFADTFRRDVRVNSECGVHQPAFI